jgi:hypothetical protein
MICYLILIISCKHKGDQTTEEDSAGKIELPADFIEFYKLFHQDSAYQIAHVTFPLSGILQDTAGRDSAVTWLAENWKIHKQVIPDDLWAVDFTIPMEGVIIEFIHARTAGYYMERRFAKMGDTWNLIYYAGLQSLRSAPEELDSLIEEGELEIEE